MQVTNARWPDPWKPPFESPAPRAQKSECPTDCQRSVLASFLAFEGWDGTSRLHIRHLPEHHRPLRSRRCGHVSRQPMPCVPRQQRKRRGLLGFCGHSELFARRQSHPIGSSRAASIATSVLLRAPPPETMKSTLLPFHLRPHESRVASRNRLRRECRRCGQRIFGILAVRRHSAKNSVA